MIGIFECLQLVSYGLLTSTLAKVYLELTCPLSLDELEVKMGGKVGSRTNLRHKLRRLEDIGIVRENRETKKWEMI